MNDEVVTCKICHEPIARMGLCSVTLRSRRKGRPTKLKANLCEDCHTHFILALVETWSKKIKGP